MTTAGVVALAAVATVVASLAYLHLEPTGLSPVRNAVSQYGITSFRRGYRVATLAFAVAGVALAVAVSDAALHRATSIIALLIVFAVARAAISWLPMDVPGTERTLTGQIHGLLAIAAFGSAAIAAVRLSGVLAGPSRWHALAGVSAALGWVMIASLVAMGFARSHPAIRQRFGAIERGFYLAAIAWFTVFGVAAAARLH